jgi:hypothetical protein
MQKYQRRALAMALAITAVVTVGGCGRDHAEKSAAESATQGPHKVQSVHRSISSGDPTLTTAEKLDRMLELPGTPGIVRGVVLDSGTPVKARSKSMFPTNQAVFTDYKFKVIGWLGLIDSPYQIGSTIALRVPGGETGNDTSVEAHGMLAQKPGNALYVVYTDHGVEGGGNSATQVIATVAQDIWPIAANGKAMGQGPFSDFAEPVATFEARFRKK